MVVVKIELWPHGDASKARKLGQVCIANDGSGTRSRGNYTAAFWGKPGRSGMPPRLHGRDVVLSGFPRLSQTAFHLLRRVLEAARY